MLRRVSSLGEMEERLEMMTCQSDIGQNLKWWIMTTWRDVVGHI